MVYMCIIYTYTHILLTGESFEMPSEVLTAEWGGMEVVHARIFLKKTNIVVAFTFASSDHSLKHGTRVRSISIVKKSKVTKTGIRVRGVRDQYI